MNTKEERSIAFGLKAVYVTLALAMASGGVAWGTMKSQAGENSRATNKNAAQIEKLTTKLNDLSTTQATINERTKRIAKEQTGIRDDIKTLLLRLPARPPSERLR